MSVGGGAGTAEGVGPRQGRRPVVTRSLWTLVGQVLSSSSNFVVSLVVLTTASPAEFATFSIGLTSYLLVTQLARSVLSLPILMLYSDRGAGSAPVAERAGPAVAACVAAGIVGSVGLVAASLGYPTGRGQLLVLAAFLPALQYQDVVRHVAIAAARPELAARSDGAWLGAQILLSIGVAVAGAATPATMLAVWAATGSASGLLYGLRLGVIPRPGRARAWMNLRRGLLARLAVEFVVSSGSFYGLSYGLAAVAGTSQLGRLRAAQSLIGPVSVLLLGGTALGVPESVRARGDPRRVRRFAVVLSCGLGVAALVGGALVYGALPSVGPRVFPQTWATARPLLPLLSLFAAAVGVSTGAVAALRAWGETAWIVRGRACSGAVALIVGLPSAAAAGAGGALLGLACSEVLYAVAAWARLRRALAGPGGWPAAVVAVATVEPVAAIHPIDPVDPLDPLADPASG